MPINSFISTITSARLAGVFYLVKQKARSAFVCYNIVEGLLVKKKNK